MKLSDNEQRILYDNSLVMITKLENLQEKITTFQEGIDKHGCIHGAEAHEHIEDDIKSTRKESRRINLVFFVIIETALFKLFSK